MAFLRWISNRIDMRQIKRGKSKIRVHIGNPRRQGITKTIREPEGVGPEGTKGRNSIARR